MVFPVCSDVLRAQRTRDVHTVHRLPPGVASIAVQVDDVVDAVAVSVSVRVVAMLRVTLETFVGLLLR